MRASDVKMTVVDPAESSRFRFSHAAMTEIYAKVSFRRKLGGRISSNEWFVHMEVAGIVLQM